LPVLKKKDLIFVFLVQKRNILLSNLQIFNIFNTTRTSLFIQIQQFGDAIIFEIKKKIINCAVIILSSYFVRDFNIGDEEYVLGISSAQY